LLNGLKKKKKEVKEAKLEWVKLLNKPYGLTEQLKKHLLEKAHFSSPMKVRP
jgi:hypothetical protein